MNIEKEELVRRLKIAEPYNNQDVPQYIWSIINGMPSAERIGHWVELYENNYQCSECNAWWTCEDTPIASGMNFCPNCGVRMKGEQNVLQV